MSTRILVASRYWPCLPALHPRWEAPFSSLGHTSAPLCLLAEPVLSLPLQIRLFFGCFAYGFSLRLVWAATERLCPAALHLNCLRAFPLFARLLFASPHVSWVLCARSAHLAATVDFRPLVQLYFALCSSFPSAVDSAPRCLYGAPPPGMACCGAHSSLCTLVMVLGLCCLASGGALLTWLGTFGGFVLPGGSSPLSVVASFRPPLYSSPCFWFSSCSLSRCASVPVGCRRIRSAVYIPPLLVAALVWGGLSLHRLLPPPRSS